MKQTPVLVVALWLTSILFFECKKEKAPVNPLPTSYKQQTDSNLFAIAKDTNGYYYYKGSNVTLTSAKASAHDPYFRVRFNKIAWNALTDSGKLPVGGSFPVGSVIVKELHPLADGSNVRGWAVMEKMPEDTNAVEGWIWAEYTNLTKPTGIALTTKGVACLSCHSADDRDKIRLFNLFP